MDPLSAAAHRLGTEVGEFLRTPGMRTLGILAPPEQRQNVLKTLRLVEYAPDNRRPMFISDEPFESVRLYATRVTRALAVQFEQLRADLGVRGIELPELLERDTDDPIERLAFAIVTIAASLGEHVDGVLLALAPQRVADAAGLRAFLKAFLRWPMPAGRVHLFVIGEAGEDLDTRVRFEVPRRRFFAFIQSIGHESAVKPLRATMLVGWKALADGKLEEAAHAHARAVELCRARGRGKELVAALLSLGGVALARGDPEAAERTFTEAALSAENQGHSSQAAQAWLGVAALARALGKQEIADVATAAARAAAVRARMPGLAHPST